MKNDRQQSLVNFIIATKVTVKGTNPQTLHSVKSIAKYGAFPFPFRVAQGDGKMSFLFPKYMHYIDRKPLSIV